MPTQNNHRNRQRNQGDEAPTAERSPRVAPRTTSAPQPAQTETFSGTLLAQ